MHSIQYRVAGKFRLTAEQRDEEGNTIPGTERVVADWFDNLITNSGMDYLKTTTDFLNYVRVGAGSTAPAVTDTALVSQVAVAAFTTITAGPSDSTNPAATYTSVNCSVQFGKGVAAGNLSEIGVSPTSSGNLFCRALIKDGTGTPITITVLPIEYLTVTYQWRVYLDTTYTSTASFTINGTSYTTTCMPITAYFSAYNWVKNGPTIGTTSGFFTASCWDKVFTGVNGALTSGAVRAAGSKTITKGTAGNYYTDFVLSFSESQANFGSGSIAAFGCWDSNYSRVCAPFGVNVSPPLPKNNTQTVSITIRFSYARYSP